VHGTPSGRFASTQRLLADMDDPRSHSVIP